MPINWKNRAKRFEQDLLALHEKTTEIGWTLAQEKDACRKSNQDYMIAQQKLMRAITTIETAVEMFTALRQHAHAATFRMIANDLSPRDTCAPGVAKCMAAIAEEERR